MQGEVHSVPLVSIFARFVVHPNKLYIFVSIDILGYHCFMRDKSVENKVIELAKAKGIIRAVDLEDNGLSRYSLKALFKKGVLDRVGRGLYRLPQFDMSLNGTFAQVIKSVPSGVIALLSALRFHEITTQNPFETWVALEGRGKRHTPIIDFTPVRFVYFTGQAMTAGIETHHVDGVEIKVFSVAKTIADCFKLRNKVGIDVAIEALKEAWLAEKVEIKDLREMAEICRVLNIMRPYMEML